MGTCLCVLCPCFTQNRSTLAPFWTHWENMDIVPMPSHTHLVLIDKYPLPGFPPSCAITPHISSPTHYQLQHEGLLCMLYVLAGLRGLKIPALVWISGSCLQRLWTQHCVTEYQGQYATAPGAYCNSCASSAAFPECLDRAQSNEAIRKEDRKDVYEDLIFLPSTFLLLFIPQFCLSSLLLSPPSFVSHLTHFLLPCS